MNMKKSTNHQCQKFVELLQAWLAESQLQPQDLVPIFGNESTVGEVLNGDRQLADNSYQELADFFHISPSMF